MLQNATPLRKSARRPPNSSDEHVSCTTPATENASLQILFKCPMPAIAFGNATNPHVLLTFDEMHNPVRLPRETTSERQKVVRTCSVFNILTSKCASRYNGAHFHFQKCSEREVLLAFPLANVLRARTEYFSALRSHKSLEKHSESRLSYLFARLDLLSSEIFPFVIFFVLFFSSLTLPISAFHLSVLSEV